MTEIETNSGAADQPTQDDNEWGRAFDEFSANKGLNPADPIDDKKGGADAGTDANKGTGAGTDAATGTGSDGDQAGAGDDAGADAGAAGDEDDANAPIRSAREIQRELDEDRKQTITDVKEKMFSDLKTELTDMDGDPIRTPEDVMKLMNPNTGKAFTYEEAAMYLLQAQQHLARENEKAEAQITEIAEVNLTVKDEASAVRARWGKLLAAKPELAKETWEDYKTTLVTDPKTGIITKAPVSMQRFYNRALGGYEAQAQTAQTAEQQTAAAETARKAAEAKAARVTNKADRGDITSNGKSDTTDPEDKEWGEAFKKHYQG
jgi:hypothetical protein